MKKTMIKAMWIISFAALAGTAAALLFLPESIPMHHDLAGRIDRWGSRYESLVFPVIILALSLNWTLFMRHYEKKAQAAPDEKEKAGAETNARVLGIVGVSMAAAFTVMQGFMLYGAWREAVSAGESRAAEIGRVSVILMGVLMLVLGNFMTKTRPNGAVGVRMAWSMYNERTWTRSNRFGAIALMAAGVLTIVTGALTANSFGATMAALGYLLLAVVLTAVYAHRVYVQEKEAESRAGNTD